MQKLKQKTSNNLNLVNYQYFLKNNSLKKNKIKLKQNLFQNDVFFKNKDLINVEFNKFKNYFLPLSKGKKITYTIQTQYENNSLLNYNFNYNILYYFTKLFFLKKKNKIKGKIINYKKKNIIISIFGLIFVMKQKNLFKNKRIFYSKKKNINKKKHIISLYKLRYLNFKIEKNFLSRRAYVQEIIDKKKIT